MQHSLIYMLYLTPLFEKKRGKPSFLLSKGLRTPFGVYKGIGLGDIKSFRESC